MSIALELRAVGKRFVAGIPRCFASVQALRGVDLTLRTGDAVCLVGAAGAGKSTLLLCAAGLLVPDRGVVRWFECADRELAPRYTTYHFAGAAPFVARRAILASPHIYLLDGGSSPSLADDARVARWIARRKARDDVIVMSARTTDTARRLGLRALILRDGHIQAETTPSTPARVAEPRQVNPIGASS